MGAILSPSPTELNPTLFGGKASMQDRAAEESTLDVLSCSRTDTNLILGSLPATLSLKTLSLSVQQEGSNYC